MLPHHGAWLIETEALPTPLRKAKCSPVAEFTGQSAGLGRRRALAEAKLPLHVRLRATIHLRHNDVDQLPTCTCGISMYT